MIETGKELSSRTASIGFFITTVLPQVSRELRRWNRHLDRCPDWEIFRLATSSLRRKRFHSQGGSFFALYNPRFARHLISVIVALQTISDYLDNLCDRVQYQNEAAFRYLHLAMLDALTPGQARKESYYRFYHLKEDGGYLQTLVRECQRHLMLLPSYPVVKSKVLYHTSLYNDLQVFKHLYPPVRRHRLKSWYKQKGASRYGSLNWWEFAAACGSTLPVFALLGLATSPGVSEADVEGITQAYFPWVCGLHILLDYFIDQEEDIREGDFNFVNCYESPQTAQRRLLHFLKMSLHHVSQLPRPTFHRSIIKGLLAVYLSDPKAQRPDFQATNRALFDAAGSDTRYMHYFCLSLRRMGIL